MKKNIGIILSAMLVATTVVGCASKPAPLATTPSTPSAVAPAPEKNLEYPKGDITFLVPSGAGGGNDLTTRALIPEMQRELGVNVVPINKGESKGAIAASEIMTAKPDGQTLYFNSQTLVLMPYGGMPDIKIDEFQPVAQVVSDTGVVYVKADSPYKTIEDFVTSAKTNQVKVAHNGVGAIWHLAALQLSQKAELSIMAYISPGSTVKGLISGLIGLIVATIGFDPVAAVPRFTFGSMYLFSGVNFTAAMIGLFGMTEILLSTEKKYKERKGEQIAEIKNPLQCFKHLKGNRANLMRSSIIGVIVGAIPGAGGTIASIVAYAQQKKMSKNPEKMGSGAIEGVVAAETANNACTGGAMITLLSLGIPGDAVTAILIGAFIIHGLTPGPTLFSTNFNLVSAIFIGMLIINVLILVLGLFCAPYFAKLLKVPKPIMNTVILLLCVIGTFGVQNSMFDVFIMALFALVGYLMTKMDLPRAPIVLALILGPLMEENLRRWVDLANGSYGEFFISSCAKNPIAPIIFAITIFTLVSPMFGKKAKLSEDMAFKIRDENEKSKEKAL